MRLGQRGRVRLGCLPCAIGGRSGMTAGVQLAARHRRRKQHWPIAGALVGCKARWRVLTVNFRQPSHEFTFNVGIDLIF
jgi:hypothetical protein